MNSGFPGSKIHDLSLPSRGGGFSQVLRSFKKEVHTHTQIPKKKEVQWTVGRVQ